MLLEQLKGSALIVQGAEKYNALQARDQQALKLVSTFFAVLFIIFALLQPAANYHAKAESQYRQNHELYTLIKSNEKLFSSYQSAAPSLSAQSSTQSLLGLANSSAKLFDIKFKRFEPGGDDVLSLWLEATVFNDLILWLERLDMQHGIRVNELDIDSSGDVGVVDVRLVLQG